MLRGKGEELLSLGEAVDLFDLLVISSGPVDSRFDEGWVFWIVAVKELDEGPTGRLLPVVDVPGPHNDNLFKALLLGNVVWNRIGDPTVHAQALAGPLRLGDDRH